MTEAKSHFHDFLYPDNILCRVKAANSAELLDLLLSLLARHYPTLNRDFAAREVAAREAIYPTVIAPGLAVPHARLPRLTAPLVAMACAPEGVDFGSEFGPVKVTVLLLTPADDPGLHLQILSALAGDFAAPDAVERVGNLGTPREVVETFRGTSTLIPSYLRAGDMMRERVTTLYENDTLEEAIRTFAVTGADEIVVIDRAGDLRGVIGLFDLISYSLPEHLLWMEDLTPIYQFQPFADMLKASPDTKVADVMREEFISVDREVPAVQLAKLFLKHRTPKLIITGEGGKLAGIVVLREFCAKLFWK